MEAAAFVFGLMGFIFGMSAYDKVRKLEKKLNTSPKQQL